ncbi:MAG TPA: PhzF family phenazine biosynthesis protein [Thermoplasmatales archaeon]|nr:PhzF family phenazine biosynthesis protein [Thermoplasmatales archaeon]
MEMPFYIVNAFTDRPLKGNPAGVVLDADDLEDYEMQNIAAELKCSETAFVMGSRKADLKIRFFSPLREVDLCGHATIASFHTMTEMGLMRKNKLTMETKSGVLGVEIRDDGVFMEQSNPVFREVNIDRGEIADALNIDESGLSDLPVEAVSTGLFSLNVPVKHLKTMKEMEPDFEMLKRMCEKIGVGSLFAFTFETLNRDCLVHTRCFAPLYGVNEDPVTGTANGALGAYLKKHGLLKSDVYKSEQGYEMGREGTVAVDVSGDAVKVGGKAYIVMQGTLEV